MGSAFVTSDSRAVLTHTLLLEFGERDGSSPGLDAMLDLLKGTLAPFSREQFEPGHFTASALVVAPSEHLVLLMQHPKLGGWLQPGGHIESEDPSPLIAAAREVEEETGLSPVFDSPLFDVDVHLIPARQGQPEHLHFDLRFLGRLARAVSPSGGEEISCRWFQFEEAMATTSDKSVRRMLDRARSAGML